MSERVAMPFIFLCVAIATHCFKILSKMWLQSSDITNELQLKVKCSILNEHSKIKFGLTQFTVGWSALYSLAQYLAQKIFRLITHNRIYKAFFPAIWICHFLLFYVFLAEPAGLILKILLLLFKFLSNKFNQSDQNEGRILLSFDICKSSHHQWPKILWKRKL